MGNKLLLVKRGKYVLLGPNERRPKSDLPACAVPGLRLVGRPSVGGDTLALSSRHERRVWLFDIPDLEHPRLTRQYSLSGHPGACGFWNGRVVIPAG